MSGTTTNFKYNTNDLGQIYATYSDNTSFLTASTTTATGFKNGTTDIGSTLVKFSEITPPSTGLTGDRGDPCGYYSNGYNNSSTDIGTYFVKKGTIRWTAAITGTPTVTRNTYSLTFNFDYVGVPTEIDVYLNDSTSSSGNYTSITSGGGSGSIPVSSLSPNTQYSYILSTFITGGIKTFSTTKANTYTWATITVSKSTTAATYNNGPSRYSVTFGGEKESYNLYAQSSAGGTITTNGTSSLGTETTTTLYFFVVPVDKLGISNTANGQTFTIDYVPWVKPTVTVSNINTSIATSSGATASFSESLSGTFSYCYIYVGTSASGSYSNISSGSSFTGSISATTNYYAVPYDSNGQAGDGAGFSVTYRPWSAPALVTASNIDTESATSTGATASFSETLGGTFSYCYVYVGTSASGSYLNISSGSLFTGSISATTNYFAVPYDSNGNAGTGVGFTITYRAFVFSWPVMYNRTSSSSAYSEWHGISYYNPPNDNYNYVNITRNSGGGANTTTPYYLLLDTNTTFNIIMVGDGGAGGTGKDVYAGGGGGGGEVLVFNSFKPQGTGKFLLTFLQYINESFTIKDLDNSSELTINSGQNGNVTQGGTQGAEGSGINSVWRQKYNYTNYSGIHGGSVPNTNLGAGGGGGGGAVGSGVGVGLYIPNTSNTDGHNGGDGGGGFIWIDNLAYGAGGGGGFCNDGWGGAPGTNILKIGGDGQYYDPPGSGAGIRTNPLYATKFGITTIINYNQGVNADSFGCGGGGGGAFLDDNGNWGSSSGGAGTDGVIIFAWPKVG